MEATLQTIKSFASYQKTRKRQLFVYPNPSKYQGRPPTPALSKTMSRRIQDNGTIMPHFWASREHFVRQMASQLQIRGDEYLG